MRARDLDRGVAGARALDEADGLARFRSRFALPRDRGRTLTYLCGHSLGLMPRTAPHAVAAELTRWAERGVAAGGSSIANAATRCSPPRASGSRWSCCPACST